MKRLIFGLLIIFIFILSGCSAISKPTGETSKTTTAVTTEAALVKASDFQLNDTNGDKIKLSDYRGKMVIINFFATWCDPCKTELPGFIRVMDGLKDNKNVRFMFIDIGESKDKVISFIKFKNYKTLVPLLDLTQDTADSYGIRGIPATFIIDKDGNIVFNHVGLMEQEDLKQAIDSIDN